MLAKEGRLIVYAILFSIGDHNLWQTNSRKATDYQTSECSSDLFSVFSQAMNSYKKNSMYQHHPFWQMTWYFWVLVGIVILYASIFQFLMVHVEGVQHSWITAFYWVLMVMSTLGFGDVAFQSDIGRLFTMMVLTTGVIQVMILLPVVFIRFSPWIERITRLRVPSHIPKDIENHVIITCYEPLITPGLLSHLQSKGIPAYVLQPDKEIAAQQYVDGLPVIVGDSDTFETYERLRISKARLVFANDLDTRNTNTILTIREFESDVQIVALAHKEQSVDVLELSGANHVLPLKTWLGEQLANRVMVFYFRWSKVGVFGALQIAEMAVEGSFLENKRISETGLRERTGLSIAGIWERSQLVFPASDLRLKPDQVLVLVGDDDQLRSLEQVATNSGYAIPPVLVIGGGRVGIAAAKRLKQKNIKVHLLERDPDLEGRLSNVCDRVYIGEADEYDVLLKAGIMEAPAVIITTNEDAENIYLTSYCRHLNKAVRIVTRITHERNIEATHRAGSDLVLRYTSLGVEAVLAVMENRPMMILGEHVRFYHIPTPEMLYLTKLSDSQIGSATGMIVLAVESDNKLRINPPGEYVLPKGSTLHVLGSADQLSRFRSTYQN